MGERNNLNVVTGGKGEIIDATKGDVLSIFYRNNSIFSKIMNILTGKATDPASLVSELEKVRQEFNKLDIPKEVKADDYNYEQAA